jgi:5-methylcytosine-specific restriction protein A
VTWNDLVAVVENMPAEHRDDTIPPILATMLANEGIVVAKVGAPEEGRSGKWPAVRAAFLKDHPTCAVCAGTSVLNVHHKKPWHLWPSLELSSENLITLCEAKHCHLMHGHGGDWKAFLPDVEDEAAKFLQRVKDRRYTK